MDYYKLQEAIRQGQISSVYLFSGEEPYLARQLIRELEQSLLEETTRDFNYDLFDGDICPLISVLEAASTFPVFAEKRLVVVKNAPWFSSRGKEKGEDSKDVDFLLLDYLQQPSPSTCLVFLVEGKIDKRRKVVRELSKQGVAWDSQGLEGQTLGRFIKEWLGKRGKKIATGPLSLIVAGNHGGLELLVRELEKLEVYLGDRIEVSPEDIEAVMVFPEENSIFELTDAVGTKEVAKALWLLRRMIQAGEPPVYILIMLARQLRLILHAGALAEEGYSPSQMAPKMQAHPYTVKKALSQARNYSKEELVFALEKVLETDVAIKTGLGEPIALLERTVLELCS